MGVRAAATSVAGWVALVLAALLFSGPASADVHEVSERGFVTRHVVDLPGSPADAWQALVAPSGWWNGEHTYSGDPANLSLEPRAGACFCEVLPTPGPAGGTRGSIEHMRVIYVEEGRALRLSGGLGPLQADAVIGTLTVMLKPTDGGTRVLFEYVVGGYLRRAPADMAPLVDRVLGEQFARFASKLGGGLTAMKAPAEAQPAVPAPEGGSREDTSPEGAGPVPSGPGGITPIDPDAPDADHYVPEPIVGR